MKKNYDVTVRIRYKVFYEDDGWIDDCEYKDFTIEDIERDDIEAYINAHKPRPTYPDNNTQYMITGVELISINNDDEDPTPDSVDNDSESEE